MSAEITELFKSLNIVLGALCAVLGAVLQSRYNEKHKQKALLCEKLERSYSLCQSIYDGHQQEINNALAYLPLNKEEFLRNRNHPGKETSELKMLLRSYVPDITYHLAQFDEGHTPLKDQFYELEQSLHSGTNITRDEINQKSIEWKEKLQILGNASHKIKLAISSKLHDITK